MDLTGSTSPKVSVIIPVYNGANYLCEAIESVLAQSFLDCEVIVVDDGSVDDTWSIIQGFGERVKGFHKENGGVASALNSGIRQATGSYVAWLSHDDLFLPLKIENQLRFIHTHPEYVACYTDYDLIDAQGILLKNVRAPWYPRLEAICTLIGKMYINGSTMMISRAIFDQVGYFGEDLMFTQDVDMWIRILRNFEIGHLGETLTQHRLHAAQGSRNFEKHIAEEEIIYSKLFIDLLSNGLLPGTQNVPPGRMDRANAYLWFGDTMRVNRRWYAFADRQYAQSLALNPSIGNPARWKRLANQLNMWTRDLLRPFVHHARQVLGVRPKDF
jgi:glycosyltransferase involved in cell wall biosynthesis